MLFWLLVLGAIVGVKLYLHHFYSNLYWEWDNGADGETRPRKKIDTEDLSFPDGFLWGTATASYQIEGGCINSQWHSFEKQLNSRGEPRIKNGDTAIVSCDHWNRMKQDVQLMINLGLNSYRFSIEWSRIEPRPDELDDSAIKRYHELIDMLIDANIQPMITLHHFSEPQWFSDLGGFESEPNIQYFVRFSVKMFSEFGSKVRLWATINEPAVFVVGGWVGGTFPPGKKDCPEFAFVLKNLLQAHVLVYQALKRLPHGSDAQIGIVKDIFQFDAYNPLNPLDHVSAYIADQAFNESVLEFFRSGHFSCYMPGKTKVEFVDPKAPTTLDWVGLNYYSHYLIQAWPSATNPFVLRHPSGHIMTDMPYTIYAEGLYRAVMRISALNRPVYVTENGIADAKDDRRELFIRRYLYALSQAIRHQCDVRGYFYWSLTDNFEWAEGYTMRFGLYEVNFETQERRLRHGAEYYRKVIKRFSS